MVHGRQISPSYKAVYDDSYFVHGKFKYIDKWKSKAGKWVYKYRDASKMSSGYATHIFNTIGMGNNLEGGVHAHANRPTQHHTQYRPKKKVRKKINTGDKRSNSRWHDSNAKAVAKGYTKTRLRTFRTGNGKVVQRREYKNEGDSRSLDFSTRRTNAAIKDYFSSNYGLAGKAARAVMDLNDKYGPKQITEIKNTNIHTGQVYVERYTSNVLGFGRAVSAESYEYNVNEDKIRKRKKQKAKKIGGGISQ